MESLLLGMTFQPHDTDTVEAESGREGMHIGN